MYIGSFPRWSPPRPPPSRILFFVVCRFMAPCYFFLHPFQVLALERLFEPAVSLAFLFRSFLPGSPPTQTSPALGSASPTGSVSDPFFSPALLYFPGAGSMGTSAVQGVFFSVPPREVQSLCRTRNVFRIGRAPFRSVGIRTSMVLSVLNTADLVSLVSYQHGFDRAGHPVGMDQLCLSRRS